MKKRTNVRLLGKLFLSIPFLWVKCIRFCDEWKVWEFLLKKKKKKKNKKKVELGFKVVKDIGIKYLFFLFLLGRQG
jgi:hypothetical protein